MTWPSTDVPTTNADAGTDNPQVWRENGLDLTNKFNQLRNHVHVDQRSLLALSKPQTQDALGQCASAFEAVRIGDLSNTSASDIGLWFIRDQRGTAFDATTGVFTVPVTGIYFFSLDVDLIASSAGHQAIAQIMVNGVTTETYVYPSHEALAGRASTISFLTAGQFVRVHASSLAAGTTYRIQRFCGALLRSL